MDYYADLGDLRLAYTVRGSGPAVVLLHGAFVDRHLWEPQVAFLDDRFRVIVPDLRGHGATGPTAAAYTIELFAADIAALLDHLGLDRVILCGHSLGAMIAQILAATRPERVSALVLANTVDHSAPTRWQRLVRDVFFPREVLWPALRRVGMGRAMPLITVLGELFGSASWRQRTETLRRYTADALRAMPADEVAKVSEAAYRFAGTDCTRLTMPTLILYGEREGRGARARSIALGDAIPGAISEVIAAAGHTPTLENPRAFNEALGRFLARQG